MLQVCLNGGRGPGDAAGVPMSPVAMAEAAAASVAAGADEVHVHPRTPCGGDTLSPRVLADTLAAVRAAVPAGVPVSVTTGARAEPDPVRRLARVRSWTVLPNRATVIWHEPGAEALATALLDRGVAVDAVLRQGTDGPARFLRSSLAPRVPRIVAAAGSEEAALALLAMFARSPHTRPVLLHGRDGAAWPLFRLARRLGLAARTGLEDTLLLPDGTPARSNAQLVSAALGESAAAATVSS
ncbi:3-keto-5-aminohexanoate cleavage protein [Streptomyces roseicoloratus]|uniref:3-keto-5-aminohexanoate cleavage protein n=1 Tax=Streptomyces roseicoloratus TaxID=2508722 RepID=A0ABY9S197_9ACTN|nr:3-keto-5-aminohexanoate cleavage protein [Streptomyces roseicoloratus]WMX47809.1 3-keto-5-aminohexanoate cleavage protein [Streptomyces roseicoloratus]